MADDGLTTGQIPTTELIDDVVGNREGGVRRILMEHLAAQLAETGAIAAKFSEHEDQVDQAVIDAEAAVSDAQLIKDYIGSAVIPIGAMVPYYFDTVPEGWLRVNGQPVTPDMPDLRQMLLDDGAPTDGNGDPLLIDPSGRVIRIWDEDGGIDPDAAREIRSFQADALREHGHTYTGNASPDGSGSGSRTHPMLDSDNLAAVTGVATATEVDTDEGAINVSADETRMANVAFPLIIKAFHAYADLTGKITALGTAAAEDVASFASAAQGVKAETAVQPEDGLTPKRFGNSTTPFAGDNDAVAAKIRVSMTPAEISSSTLGVRGFASAADMITVSRWTLSGSTLTKLASISFAVDGGGEYFELLPFSVEAGEYLSIAGTVVGGHTYADGSLSTDAWWFVNDGATADTAGTAVATPIEIEFTLYGSAQSEVLRLEGLIGVKADQGNLDAVEGDLYEMVTSTLGSTADPLAVEQNATARHFIDQEAVAVKGRLQSVRLGINVTGTVTVSVWSLSGATLTQVASQEIVAGAVGEFDFAVDLPVEVGEYLSVSGSAVGVLGFTTVDPDRAYWLIERGEQSGDTSVENTAVTVAVRYTVGEYQSRFIRVQETLDSLGGQEAISMANAENKLVVIGDSTSMMSWYIKGHGWLQRVQAETAFSVYNYGIAGDNAAEQLEDLRNGNTPHGFISAEAVGAKYALVSLGINDHSDYNENTFVENMVNLCETLKGMGMQPIISTAWFGGYTEEGSETRETVAHLYKRIARVTGSHFVDMYANVRRMLDPVTISTSADLDGRFFQSIHCGTRSGALMSGPIIEFLNSLPRPRTGMKFYRARSSVVVASAEDLRFNTDLQRDELFMELLAGGRYIADADAAYYDTLTPNSAYSTAYTKGEYDRLQRGFGVALGDWSLVEVILPGMVSDCESVSVDLGNAGYTAFVCDVQSGTYPPASEPVGEMVTVPVSGNVATISQAMLQKCGVLDTLRVWVFKSGGITLANPSVSWAGGGREKRNLLSGEVRKRPRGAELLSQTDGGTASGWTVSSGSPAVGASDITHLAYDSTGVTKVTDADSISQSFSYATDGYEDKEAILNIVAAWAPPAFNQGVDTFPADSAFTFDSWPKGWLVVEVTIDTLVVRHRVPVPAYSSEISIPVELPDMKGGGSIRLAGEDSVGVEIARVSLREVI